MTPAITRFIAHADTDSLVVKQVLEQQTGLPTRRDGRSMPTRWYFQPGIKQRRLRAPSRLDPPEPSSASTVFPRHSLKVPDLAVIVWQDVPILAAVTGGYPDA